MALTVGAPLLAAWGCAAAPAHTASATEPGRAILERACTRCHDLGGVEAFAGYYDAAQWRDLVRTMVGHGATLDEEEVDVLVAYLATAYGRE